MFNCWGMTIPHVLSIAVLGQLHYLDSCLHHKDREAALQTHSGCHHQARTPAPARPALKSQSTHFLLCVCWQETEKFNTVLGICLSLLPRRLWHSHRIRSERDKKGLSLSVLSKLRLGLMPKLEHTVHLGINHISHKHTSHLVWT